MFRAFRILAVALVSVGLAAGGAWAGPGKDSGDPDIPSVRNPMKLLDDQVAPDAQSGTGAVVVEATTRVISDAKQQRWLRALRTYLRLVKVFRP